MASFYQYSDFVLPYKPEDLTLRASDERYSVQTTFDLSSMNHSEQSAMLDDLTERLLSSTDRSLLLAESDNFDVLYAFVSQYSDISPAVLGRVFDILSSGLHSLLTSIQRLSGSMEATAAPATKQSKRGKQKVQETQDDGFTEAEETLVAIRGRRHALKMYVFLLVWLTERAEKYDKENTVVTTSATGKVKKAAGKKGKADSEAGSGSKGVGSGYSDGVRESVLSALCAALKTDTSKIWSGGIPEEDFLSLFGRVAYPNLENQILLKNKVLKQLTLELIAVPAKRFSDTPSVTVEAVTKIVHMIYSFEHAASVLADLMKVVAEDYQAPKLALDVIHEIGRTSDVESNGKDGGGLRNLSTFLVELSEKIPKVFLSNISLLMPYLENESYAIRNAMVESIGNLISRALSKDEDGAKTRDQLLDVLEGRLYDKHAYARSKLLQVWIQLCKDRAIPVGRFEAVTRMAADRLKDVSSAVRKNATLLLNLLLSHNPFSETLNLDVLNQQLNQVQSRLKQIEEQALATAPAAVAVSMPAQEKEEEEEQDDEEEDETEEDEGDDKPSAVGTSEVLEKSTRAEPTPEEVKLQLLETCLLGAIRMVETLEAHMPLLIQQLGSKNNSDIQESVALFVTMHQFNIRSAQDGMRKMLVLIWSKEPSIKDCVIEAYRTLYFGNHLSSQQISMNLVNLCKRMSLADLTSLEELVTECSRLDIFPSSVHKHLWHTFGTDRAVAMADRRSALNLLTMMASTDVSIISQPQSLALLTKVGLGCAELSAGQTVEDMQTVETENDGRKKRGAAKKNKKQNKNVDDEEEEVDVQTKISSNEITAECSPKRDWLMVRDACLAIQKVSMSKGNRNGYVTFIEKAVAILLSGYGTAETSWYGAAEQVINTIFVLSVDPEPTCTQLVRALCSKVFPAEEEAEDQVESELSSRQRSRFLSQLFFVVGQVALKMLLHVESVQSDLKRKRAQRENAVVAKTAIKQQPTEQVDSGSDSDAAGKKKSKSKKAKSVPVSAPAAASSIEEELCGGTAADEERETETLQWIADTTIVNKNFLGTFGPLLLKVLSSPDAFTDKMLHKSVVMCLCKFMVVSSQFCEHNLQLLFTLLASSMLPSVRANIVICIGDLANRFPNLVEPWSEHIYGRLRDEDVSVRKHTLMVLTHLILNDMLKVKGQISDIALCLEDSESRIVDLTKLFFHELAKKGSNAIYNILPDTIGRLSRDATVTPEIFQRVCKFLVQFIEKDKQTESLIEKLCHRFYASEDLRHWRDIAYCLSLLNVSEKGIKKLSEMSKSFLDKLHDEQIYESICQLIAKARKFAKPETKGAIDELEAKLNQKREEGVEQENISVNASAVTLTAADRKLAKARAAAERDRIKAELAEKEKDKENVKPVKKTRKTAPKVSQGKGRKKVVDSESSAESEDESNHKPPARPTRTAKPLKPAASANVTVNKSKAVVKPKKRVVSSEEESEVEELSCSEDELISA